MLHSEGKKKRKKRTTKSLDRHFVRTFALSRGVASEIGLYITMKLHPFFFSMKKRKRLKKDESTEAIVGAGPVIWGEPIESERENAAAPPQKIMSFVCCIVLWICLTLFYNAGLL